MISLNVRLIICFGLLITTAFCHGQNETTSSPSASNQEVPVLRFEGAMGPALSEYLVEEILSANRLADLQRPPLLMIILDTPGGLVSSLREINQAILGSKIPIACLVAPAGARAMSAGTYLLYACHIAAMAPATTLGAATPVQMGMPQTPAKPEDNSDTNSDNHSDAKPQDGKAMERKILNDAIAYIRSLAQLRGRNQAWAELAVKDAATLTAEEALESQVIDLIAKDAPSLLAKLNGWPLKQEGQTLILKLDQATLVEHPRDLRNQFIGTITNPNIAYILMLIGIYGLLLEFYNPGIGIAGVTGGIALLVALYAFQLLPINYAGLGLMMLGIVLLIAESMVPSFGIFGLGGALAFALGSIFLLDTDNEFAISLPLIAAVTVTVTLFSLWVLSTLWKNRHQRPVSGDEAILGAYALVITGFQGQGFVLLGGETWAAICDTPTSDSQKVQVIARDDLTLTIKALSSTEAVSKASNGSNT
jgi:membrane-bound serine protease (ClpP class)